MYFFTSDEHYGHTNIIKWCKRPLSNLGEMNVELIKRHNQVVGHDDITIHAGDFCWPSDPKKAAEFIKQLNGNHVFLMGSHDRWMRQATGHDHLWQKRIEGQVVVVDHYAMRVWPRSHYNSWHLFGHSHTRLGGAGKSFDIGVDGHNFYPWSWNEVVGKMERMPNNFNLVEKD